ncbi:MAG TPA: ABC transporter ATP-binding protein [Solirubrobacteraceae bacterium]|nr:ABC transporter ATP-binding protein [Solirubrobacteraceae bacterium]
MPTSRDDSSETARPPALLVIDDVAAGYGASLVIDGVSAAVGRGEVVCVIGANGSGKSTLLKAVTGDLTVQRGRVSLDDDDVTNLPRDLLVRRGIGYVPQDREVFTTLSVRENLQIGGYLLRRRKAELAEAIERVFTTFPALAKLQKSAAGALSGGERKMLAIGRALMTSPKVVVLDEPSAGLAPAVGTQVLAERIPALAESGTGVLLVEQRALQALEHSHWGYVMIGGKVELSGRASGILARGDVGELFLGRGREELPRPHPHPHPHPDGLAATTTPGK